MLHLEFFAINTGDCGITLSVGSCGVFIMCIPIARDIFVVPLSSVHPSNEEWKLHNPFFAHSVLFSESFLRAVEWYNLLLFFPFFLACLLVCLLACLRQEISV